MSRYIGEQDTNSEGLCYDLIFSDEHPLVSSSSDVEVNIVELISEMKGRDIDRDPITYRNAMLSCRSDGKAAIRLLDLAFEDIETFNSAVLLKWRSMKDIKAYLINTALYVCARNGDIDLISKLFKYMRKNNIHADTVAMNHLVVALSSSGNCMDSMWALNAMKGDGAANAMFVEKYNIDIIGNGDFNENPMIEQHHYSSAITGCLRHGELFPALKILNGMKVHGLTPNESSLQGIILAYCKLATEASSAEFKEARLLMDDLNGSKSTANTNSKQQGRRDR